MKIFKWILSSIIFPTIAIYILYINHKSPSLNFLYAILICIISSIFIYISFHVFGLGVSNLSIKLSFSTFKKYYILNPKRYKLEGYAYRLTGPEFLPYENYIYKNNSDRFGNGFFLASAIIRFGYIGYIRYYIWRISEKLKKEKQIINQNQIKNTEIYLKLVQNDIYDIKKKSEREIEKARKINNKIESKMKG